MSDAIVLDSSALLALLFKEEGASVVAGYLPNAIIGSVNLSETIAKLLEAGVPPGTASQIIGKMELDTRNFDAADAFLAAMMRPATKSHGLSLGDRACLALAQKLDAKVLTADRAWQEIDTETEIELIR